jgi:S-adenosylmethionine-diacylglycerol 3-amino-3-carboxypropyl transferase
VVSGQYLIFTDHRLLTTKTMSQDLLLDAVQNKPATSRQGILQKLFAVYFDGLVYNQIWEDPRVDLQALKLNGESRVLSIASGGCNALNYLTAQPESVTAVDLNPNHLYLTRLKIAALRYLPDYPSFFDFFGRANVVSNVANYQRYLAPRLDADTRQFWDKRIHYFAKGFYNYARNGYFLRFFHRFARTIGCNPDDLTKAKTLAEQEQFFEKNVAPFFDNFLIKLLSKTPITVFGLGIPPQQFEELKRDAENGIIGLMRERVHRLCAGFPIADNYFAWQAFTRHYDTVNRVAIPDYLKEENYPQLKENSPRVRAEIASIIDFIKQERVESFNRFVFLDAQDWMNRETLTDLWTAIASRAGKNARIIFRTAGAESPLETALPADLLEKFDYQKDFSRDLHLQDRAAIYGGFHLYILK